MKTLNSYTQFFSDMAENHKAIESFYRTHFTGDPFGDHLALAEITEALNNIELPTLLLQAYDLDIIDNDSDNVLQRSKGAFWVLKKSAFNDFDARQSVLNEMEVVGKQIIAYMKQYFLDTNMTDMDIQLRSFSIERCGPIFDECYGARIDFDYVFSVNNDLIYSSSMDQYWNNPLDS